STHRFFPTVGICLKSGGFNVQKVRGQDFCPAYAGTIRGLITYPEGMQQEAGLFLIKLAEKRFKDLLKKPYLAEAKITPIVKHFKVFSEVNNIALEHQADLVIMGSHGTDGLEEIFIGSNAEKVVRNSEVPVLVIKDNHENF